MLRHRQRLNESSLPQNCIIQDSNFATYLQQHWMVYADDVDRIRWGDEVIAYIDGRRPLGNSHPWWERDIVRNINEFYAIKYIH